MALLIDGGFKEAAMFPVQLYRSVIVTQTPSFRRSRDLDKSNKFGQMQELTNDNYLKLSYVAYSVLNQSINQSITLLRINYIHITINASQCGV